MAARSFPALELISINFSNLLNKYLYFGILEERGIEADVCFDCTLWNEGFYYDDPDDDPDAGPELIIPPIKQTFINYLTELEDALNEILSDEEMVDYGFKTQIERLLTIISDLKNKVSTIQCKEVCGDITIMSQLLNTLVISITSLIVIIEVVNGLYAYFNACGCIGAKFFELLMGRFINAITDLQAIMQDWYTIVMTFFHFASLSTKSYVASYMPRPAIPMPQPQLNMSHACVPCPPRPPQPCPQPNHCTPYPY